MSAVDVIDEIRVIAHDETHNTGNIPFEVLPALIVEHQSLQVDAVSGATISSMGFMVAVRDAIATAGADASVFVGEALPDVPHEDTTTDIVVIGGGGAGLTAAIHAAYEGHDVILVEKLGILGGTTNYVLEGFGSINNLVHGNLGIENDPDALVETLATNNPQGDPEAFEILAHNNGWAADWLRSIGAMMNVAPGRMSVASSREVGIMGVTIVSALVQEAQLSGVDIRTNSEAIEILMEDGAVSGVVISTPHGEYTINASAVIIATGGFAANLEMVAEHRPELEGFPAAPSPGNQGSGHMIAEAIGAELLNMDHIRMNYTYSIAESGLFYYVASVVNTGAIVVNDAGERFINDQQGHGAGPAVLEQGGTAWAIFDNTIYEGVSEVRRLANVDLFIIANTLEELADLTGIDQAGLMDTIERYQGFVEEGVDEDFGRAMVNMRFVTAPFHALPLTVHAQGTFGGVSTNVDAEVLNADAEPIPGLFAAGEVANDGTWGANPAVVNVVFGRIAALSASEFINGQ
ncbi:MAG: FAD-binding protein [Turicibacter sp.]|nr:FAD-binding protein [Turicibacter sp.]